MTEQTKKIVLPAYLVRRCEAFRIVKGERTSFLLRDKLHDKTYDFEPWQFFILEVLPGCESLEKLQSVFKDRFDRPLTRTEVDELFDSLAERKLLDESALQHPLLKPFASQLYDVVDGRVAPKPTAEEVAAAEAAAAAAAPPPEKGPVAGQKIVLPAYLVHRCKAYRNELGGGAYTYYITDELHDKTFSFEPWQFFILEVLPGCETLEKLQSVFRDRFNRELSQPDLDLLFASIADRKIFDESALKHPLLKAYALRTYDVVDGKAVLRSHAEKVNPSAKSTAAPPAVKPEVKELPAGVQDVVGLDPSAGSRLFPLFDPRPILKWLVPIVKPLRYLAYGLPVMVIVALMLVAKNSQVLAEDMTQLRLNMSLFGHLVFSLLTLNLFATIVFGCTAYSYRAAVERFCITLYVGFIPRFVNRITGYEQMSRREFMNTHASSLLFRLFVFCCSVFVWYNTRDLQGASHEVAVELIICSAGSLIVETGNPLVKGHAYFILSTYLNEPHLRGKAYKALLNKMRAGVYQESDNTILSIYALAFITYAFALVTFVTLGLGKWMMSHLDLGGSAIIIILSLLAYLFWRNYVNLKKFGESYERTMQFDLWRKRTLIDKGESEGEVKSVRPSYWGRAVLIGLFIALFIPYPYEPAGTFTIYPARKQVMSTDTPGLIEEVFFDGGESVKKGTVLARLAHEDYIAQIKVYDAKVEEQKNVVADLKARPKPEEVQVAQQQLDVARTREAFSREKEPRLEKLYKVGAVSFEEYDTARKEHETDVSQVEEKKAALALVKAGVMLEQIAAAEAKLVSLKEERATFEGKLERTVLRMPFDGNILTLHLQDRINSYLEKGQPFAALENTGIVTAEVEVPESDVQYVVLGAKVRVRPAAYFEREFEGKVTTIDRNITVKSFGNVIKVIATIDNHDGVLKTGMTGEGKINGLTMPLWKAFTQAVIRFVNVQVWSWIP
jgi:putative peptide zinc metalloprotease protein